MAEELSPKSEWLPLRLAEESLGPDPLETQPEDPEQPSLKMTEAPRGNEPKDDDGWQSLQGGGDDSSPDNLEAREEDVRLDFPELVDDSPEDFTEEQRQNLIQKISAMTTPEKYRLAIFANREVRSLLIHDPKRTIALAVLKNRKISESEALHYAQRKDLSEEVLSTIAKDQQWRRHYVIRSAVVTNPKTPIATALTLLPQLNERDLKTLSRDKNVSAALKRRAQELLAPKKR